MKLLNFTTVTVIVLLLLCLCYASSDVPKKHRITVAEVSSFSEDDWKTRFDAFIAKYEKKYSTTAEYNKRLDAYKVLGFICFIALLLLFIFVDKSIRSCKGQ